MVSARPAISWLHLGVPRLNRPSLSPVLPLARYGAVVEAQNTRTVPGARLTRDTAEISMAAASISSKRGSFVFFSVCLV